MAREYERWENNGYDTTTRSSGDNIERRFRKPKWSKGTSLTGGQSPCEVLDHTHRGTVPL